MLWVPGNGNRLDSVQDFLQMSGRAGRPGLPWQGSCRAYAVPGKAYSGSQSRYRRRGCNQLLQGEMLSAGVHYGEAEQLRKCLHQLQSPPRCRILEWSITWCLGATSGKIVLRLQSYRFLKEKEINNAYAFEKLFGSFPPVSKASWFGIAVLEENEPLKIATNLEFFDAAYFKYANQIGSSLHVNMPSRVFQGQPLDIVFDGESLSQPWYKIRELMLKLCFRFFNLCMQKTRLNVAVQNRGFSEKIIKLRTEALEPSQIVKNLKIITEFCVPRVTFVGYLDNAVRNLDAVELYSKGILQKGSCRKAKKAEKESPGLKEQKSLKNVQG